MGPSRLRADLEDACPEEEARPSASSHCVDVQLWGLDCDAYTHIVTNSVTQSDSVNNGCGLYVQAAELDAIRSGLTLLDLAYMLRLQDQMQHSLL